MKSEALPITPDVKLPIDEGLPGLARFFDSAWVWEAFCAKFGAPAEPPERLRLQQLLYSPGRWAMASFAAERTWDRWMVQDQFGIELKAGRQPLIFRYPEDPYLPGLVQAASALEAHELVNAYLGLHQQRLGVEPVTYMPASHAVLRHRVIWRKTAWEARNVTFFVRVVQPAKVQPILAAAEIMASSGFALPEIAGCWPEGGVIWLNRVPGETARRLIRHGDPPDPDRILSAIAQLWESPLPSETAAPVDIAGAFRWTSDLFSQVLIDVEDRRLLKRLTKALGPFAQGWRATALAHNDFHDAQLVLTPTGKLAVVDYDEAGPGDPLLDIGNFLAHQRWMARFGNTPEAHASYGDRFREAALARFGWQSEALALREAFALFRLTTNAIRNLQPDWQLTLRAGLRLALDALEGAPQIRGASLVTA